MTEDAMKPDMGKQQSNSQHWARMDERGAYWGLATVGFLFKLLGARLCFILMQPALLYFFLTGKAQRQASIDYLNRLYAFEKMGRKAGWWSAYKHFSSFALMVLDKIAAWTNRISIDQIIFPEDGEMERVVAEKQGVVVLASHFGNIEVSRALSRTKHKVKITVLPIRKTRSSLTTS